MYNILIVDDEEMIRKLIRKYAEFDGFTVTEAVDGMDAVNKFNHGEFDIIIMDIMMPELDGFTASRKIRETSDVPIIMLSARGEEYDKINGFEIGIDDYVIKPFSPKELMLRVEAIMKRTKQRVAKKEESKNEIISLANGGLVADITARIVYIDGERVDMSPKEYELFFYMLKNKNQTLLAQDSYAVLEKSFAQSEENFRIVNAKFEQGRVSEFDKISAEVQMRNLQPSVISARNAVELSKLQLLVLMNIEPETEIELQGSLTDYEESVYAGVLTADINSLKNNSTLLQLDMNAKMLRQTLSLNKQNFAPIVALQFNYMYTCMANDFKFKDYEWNPYSNVSLSVSIPLFKYSNFSNVRKTNIQISQLMQNRDYTARQLAMQQQSYLNSMAASAEQVSSNKEAITQAEKGRAIAEKLYEVGRGTILELNSAEVALTQAQLTYAQSIFDYLSAKADLDKLQGKEYVRE